MKSLIMAIGALILSVSAHAGNPEVYEHNYKFSHDNDYATYRHTSLDTWHVEYGHKFDWLDVTYRHADLRIDTENRIKFTVPVYSQGGFSLKARMEYRHFDIKESHWRYRFIAGYKYNFNQHVQAWIKLQPRWAFKDAGAQFDSRDQIGVKFSFGNVSISPYAERYTKTEWSNHTLNVFGTYFNWRF